MALGFGTVHDERMRRTAGLLWLEVLRNVVPVILHVLISSKSASAALRAIAANADRIALFVVPACGAGGAMAAVSLWAGSLGGWQWFLYWLGCLSAPVWIPVLGGTIGLGVPLAIYVGAKWSSQANRMAKLQFTYNCLHLSKNADGKITDEEQQFISGVLAPWNTDGEERAALEKGMVDRLDDLTVPEALDRDDRRCVLSTCWELLQCDGLVMTERKFFSQLRGRLGFEASEEADIETEMRQSQERRHALLVGMAQTAIFLNPRMTDEMFGRMVEVLAAMDTNAQAKARLTKNVKRATMTAAALATVYFGAVPVDAAVAGGLCLAKAMADGDPEQLRAAQDKFAVLKAYLKDERGLDDVDSQSDAAMEALLKSYASQKEKEKEKQKAGAA